MTNKRLFLLGIEKDVEIVAGASESKKTDEIKHISKRNLKASDTTKMTILVPTQMFETLQDISRSRRRAKQPFKLTELAREALAAWVPRQRF